MSILRHGNRNGRGRRILQRGVIPAAAVAGAVLIVVGLATQHSAPQAPSAAAPSSPAHPSSSTTQPSRGTHSSARHSHKHESAASHPHHTATKADPKKPNAKKPSPKKRGHSKHTSKPQALSRSKPVRLRIPHIGVNTAVTKVGRTSNDQIGNPQGKQVDDAAWFDESPTPGQYGSSVIVGHVDYNGPSVFFRLGKLRHGNKIEVTRKKGKKATFIVDKARRYPDRKKLPATKFLGGNVAHSGLRLVTCSGDFDHKTGHYRGTTIISAHLDRGS